MQLKIKKIRDDAKIPTRAHHDDAGIDLYACGEYAVAPGATAMIPIGVAIEIEFGSVGLIWDKSSIGSKSLKTLGGVIDAGYRGEFHVGLMNLSDKAYTFEKGDKIIQMLIMPVAHMNITEATELSESVRGTGAFGSSGK